jgi:hypothetical protein
MQRIGKHLVCRETPDRISARSYLTGGRKSAQPLLALPPKVQPSTRLVYEYLSNACLEPWKNRKKKVPSLLFLYAAHCLAGPQHRRRPKPDQHDGRHPESKPPPFIALLFLCPQCLIVATDKLHRQLLS